jgi:hypothetical protein
VPHFKIRTSRPAWRKSASRRKNRSALRGRSPTEAVPSVEEFLRLRRDSRAAFEAGYVGELRDLISAAEQNAHLSAERRAYTSRRIVLPDGGIDARVQPDDPIGSERAIRRCVELGHGPTQDRLNARERVAL